MSERVDLEVELQALRAQVEVAEAYAAHLHCEHTTALVELADAVAERDELRRVVGESARHEEHARQLRERLDELEQQRATSTVPSPAAVVRQVLARVVRR